MNISYDLQSKVYFGVQQSGGYGAGVSTFALQLQTPDVIQQVTERLVNNKIDIISPACGLSTKTPVQNIAAMTGTVKYS